MSMIQTRHWAMCVVNQCCCSINMFAVRTHVANHLDQIDKLFIKHTSHLQSIKSTSPFNSDNHTTYGGICTGKTQERRKMKIAKNVSFSALRPFSNRTKLAVALQHHGIKGQKWGIRRTPEELARARAIPIEDAAIRRSVGAKAKNYGILDPESGERFNFSEGTRIQNSEIFAGRGTTHGLRENVKNGLADKYGGDPEKWQHCKGNGVINYYGEDRPAEVHWF